MGRGGFVLVDNSQKVFPHVLDTQENGQRLKFLNFNTNREVNFLNVKPIEKIDEDGKFDNGACHERSITESEIKHRSKVESVAKMIIFCQLLWFLIQISARGVE